MYVTVKNLSRGQALPMPLDGNRASLRTHKTDFYRKTETKII